jgi:hypothetical protein
MKRIWLRWTVLALLAGAAGAARAELTPEELLQTVDRMNPDQVLALSKKLEARFWEPIPSGFFMRMALDLGVSAGPIDSTGVEDLSLSGGAMDLEDVGGVDVGLLWRFNNPRYKLGLRFGSFMAEDSNLRETGYSRAELTGGHVTIPLNVQWVRCPRWMLWTEAAVGVGNAQLDTVDTPAGEATTMRRFDGDYVLADVQAGVSVRLNPAISLFLSGGYRFAESVKLEEGGRETGHELDMSGGFGRVGVGFNF